MRSFDMLEVRPVDGRGGKARYYIDGKRVRFAEYYKLNDAAHHQDSFKTERKGPRWHFRKVARV